MSPPHLSILSRSGDNGGSLGLRSTSLLAWAAPSCSLGKDRRPSALERRVSRPSEDHTDRWWGPHCAPLAISLLRQQFVFCGILWQPSRTIYHLHRTTWVFCTHFVLTRAHPRREFLVVHPSQDCYRLSTLNPEILSRHASEKEDAPCCYEYSINSIKPWARISPYTGVRISQMVYHLDSIGAFARSPYLTRAWKMTEKTKNDLMLPRI